MLALNKLVTADFYYIAQVVEIGLIAAVEMTAIGNVWTHRAISYGIFDDIIKCLRLGVHEVLPLRTRQMLNLHKIMCYC